MERRGTVQFDGWLDYEVMRWLVGYFSDRTTLQRPQLRTTKQFIFGCFDVEQSRASEQSLYLGYATHPSRFSVLVCLHL